MLFEFRTFRETILYKKGCSSNRTLPGNSKCYKVQELSFNNGHYWSNVSLKNAMKKLSCKNIITRQIKQLWILHLYLDSSFDQST